MLPNSALDRQSLFVTWQQSLQSKSCFLVHLLMHLNTLTFFHWKKRGSKCLLLQKPLTPRCAHGCVLRSKHACMRPILCDSSLTNILSRIPFAIITPLIVLVSTLKFIAYMHSPKRSAESPSCSGHVNPECRCAAHTGGMSPGRAAFHERLLEPHRLVLMSACPKSRDLKQALMISHIA
jgi:hypothetical protein